MGRGRDGFPHFNCENCFFVGCFLTLSSNDVAPVIVASFDSTNQRMLATDAYNGVWLPSAPYRLQDGSSVKTSHVLIRNGIVSMYEVVLSQLSGFRAVLPVLQLESVRSWSFQDQASGWGAPVGALVDLGSPDLELSSSGAVVYALSQKGQNSGLFILNLNDVTVSSNSSATHFVQDTGQFPCSILRPVSCSNSGAGCGLEITSHKNTFEMTSNCMP